MTPSTKKLLIEQIFECTRCGYCCHGETTVSLTPYDQERMARVLGLSLDEVKEKYLRITGEVVQMQVKDGHCIFYQEDRGCCVHEGRPWRCRQWPLHPSLLSDESNFSAISTSCPGINKELSYQDFVNILHQLLPALEKDLKK